jgi:hypothetical protein
MLGLSRRSNDSYGRSPGVKSLLLRIGLALGAALPGACAGVDDASYDQPVELAESSAALVVNGEKTQGHPAAAQLGERRFIVWGGTDAQKRLNVLSSTRAGEWGGKITLDERTNGNGGVALTVFESRLYMGWTGTDDHLNIMSSSDGMTWTGKHTFDVEQSADAPALTVHDGRLYIAYTGKDDHLNLLWSDDGSTFTRPVTLEDRSHNSPSLTSFEGKLLLGWTGVHQYMNIAELDASGRILREANCTEMSWDGTFLFGFGHTLIVSWRGNFLNEQLNHAPLTLSFLEAWLNGGDRSQGLPSKVTMNDKSNRMPTWANFAGSAALLWRGTDGQLNLLEHMYELPRADLTVSITPGASSVGVTEHVTVDVALSNAGPNPAESPSAALTIPGGLSLVSCTSPDGVSCAQAGSFLLLDRESIAVGATVHTRVELAAACTEKPVSLGLWATVSSKTLDPTSGNNAASATVEVSPAKPVLSAPAAVSALTCSLDGTRVELGVPSVSDRCDPEPTVSARIVSMGGQTVDIPVDDDTVFALCESVVEYRVVNAAGLSATATQTVSVGFQHDLCASGACCPAGFSTIDLTEHDGVYSSRKGGECILGSTDADTVSLSGGGSAFFGGPGSDTLSIGAGAYELRAGDGDDFVVATGGGVSLWGNGGDDVLFIARGNNEVIPGPGLDTVELRDGDNTIIILDVCEIEEGEQIEAGPGHDVLVAPVGEAELSALGLTLSGIDEIIVDSSRGCASECRLVSESCGEL